MKVLVVGSTGGSGRAAVRHLLSRGHEVTAFTRAGQDAFAPTPGLRIAQGDALSEQDLTRAVAGQDAVVVTLGITENPLRVRMFGASRTAVDVRSVGTRHVMAAMHRCQVRRLIVQTTYGVGATRDRLGFLDKLFFELLLKPQIADTEVQDRDVASSDLDWTLVQPVHLTDSEEEDAPFASTDGATERMRLSRNSVGRFLADALESAAYHQRSVALSGAHGHVPAGMS